MSIRKIVSMFLLGAFIAASLTLTMPQDVHAQCGLPGQPPCPPSGGGGGGGKKKATPVPPKPTSTPTATLVFKPLSSGGAGTVTPDTLNIYLTVDACVSATLPSIVLTAAALTPPPNHNATMVALFNNCITLLTPTAMKGKVVIPPMAGPVFLKPGVINLLILVLLIGVLSGGTFLILRGFRPPNPNKPPSPNKKQ